MHDACMTKMRGDCSNEITYLTRLHAGTSITPRLGIIGIIGIIFPSFARQGKPCRNSSQFFAIMPPAKMNMKMCEWLVKLTVPHLSADNMRFSGKA